MIDTSAWIVVLVDDEPDSLNLIHDVLAVGGAQVHRISNGHQCLDLLNTLTPTLIILDLAMPRPDGWELLASIRANPATAGVAVVAVTAYHSPSVAEKARQAGFDAFIPKPIRSGEFLSQLKELLG